jgi:hypothetical protein
MGNNNKHLITLVILFLTWKVVAAKDLITGKLFFLPIDKVRIDFLKEKIIGNKN